MDQKRTNAISWSEWHMGIAMLTAKRSKDPGTQVGACIVQPNNVVVGIGYNGFPNGTKDSQTSWASGADVPYEQSKHPYECHAGKNAIDLRTVLSLEGCTIYITQFPCNECVKSIIQCGIKHIVHGNGEEAPAMRNISLKMLANAKVTNSVFKCETAENILVNFNELNA